MAHGKLDPSFGWEWLGLTWEIFRKQKGALLGATIVSWLVIAVAGFLPYIGQAVSGFFYPYLIAGSLKIVGCADRGERAEVGDLFSALSDSARFKRIFPLAGISAAMLGANHMVLYISQILFKQGHLNFFMLGLMVIIILYGFASTFWAYGPALLEYQNLTAAQAMERSLLLTFRNWAAFLICGLVYCGVVVLAAIPLFLGLLVVLPMVFCLPYVLYRETFRMEAPSFAALQQ